MTLKISFYFIFKKKSTIKHQKIYIHIYTHKNSQLLRWYAMILMYSKSGILLQLYFLWFLNSNLQINRLGATYKLPICQLLFKRKDINNHTLYKDQICPRVKILIHFIFHHHLQSKKLSASTIEHFNHYRYPQVSEKERMIPKVC